MHGGNGVELIESRSSYRMVAPASRFSSPPGRANSSAFAACFPGLF
jgi:hypothetical protein